MRLTLSDDEIKTLMEILLITNHSNAKSLNDTITSQLLSDRNQNKDKKQKAMEKATQTREKTVRDKIYNAMNILRLENKKISVYSVSKEAGISFNSAAKYRDMIEAQ